jgi:CBS domain-containing protein
MLVKDLMTTGVITVKPTQTVNEVAEVLYTHHFTGVPVVDLKNRLLGLIAERDFIASDSKLYLPTYIKLLSETKFISGDNKRLPKEAQRIINATAEDIMNRTLVTIRPEADLTELAEVFATKRVNPIPVVDKNFNLLGIVSRSDLIKLFSKPNLTVAASVDNLHRPIDSNVENVYGSFQERFAYVAKFRANIWLTVAIVLFVIGFLIGIVYVADPHIFRDDTAEQQPAQPVLYDIPY